MYVVMDFLATIKFILEKKYEILFIIFNIYLETLLTIFLRILIALTNRGSYDDVKVVL